MPKFYDKLILGLFLLVSTFIIIVSQGIYRTQGILEDKFLITGLDDSLRMINNSICNQYEDKASVIDLLQKKCDFYTQNSDSSIVFFADDTSGVILVNRNHAFLNLTHPELDQMVSSPMPLMTHTFEGGKLKSMLGYKLNHNKDTVINYLYDYVRQPDNEEEWVRVWRQAFLLYNSKHGIILGITRTPYLEDLNIYEMILLAYNRQRQYSIGYLIIGVVLVFISFRLWRILTKYRRTLYAINQASSAISIISKDGRITWANETYFRWRGLSSSEINNLPFWALDENNAQVIKERFLKFLDDEKEEDFKYNSKLGDKRTETIWKKYLYLKNPNEVVSVHTDITELADLVAFIPHEVKSPIQGLMTYVRGLLIKDEESISKMELIPILEGVESSMILGENLSLWAKSRYERLIEDQQEVNIHNTIKDILDPFELIINHYGIIIENKVNDQWVLTTKNKQMFNALIRNLISNSINSISKKLEKVTDEEYQGKIEVIGRIEEERYVLLFVDNGVGIESEEKLDHLFSLDNGKNGWGTAICKRFILQYGGSIRANHRLSAYGEKTGLVITVSLPNHSIL